MIYTYKIVEAPSPLELSQLVNDLMMFGWKPIGGPFTASWAPGQGFCIATGIDEHISINFFQAMTWEDA